MLHFVSVEGFDYLLNERVLPSSWFVDVVCSARVPLGNEANGCIRDRESDRLTRSSWECVLTWLRTQKVTVNTKHVDSYRDATDHDGEATRCGSVGVVTSGDDW